MIYLFSFRLFDRSDFFFWTCRPEELPPFLYQLLGWLFPTALCEDSGSERLSGPWSSAGTRSLTGLCSGAPGAAQPGCSVCSGPPPSTASLAVGAGILPLQEITIKKRNYYSTQCVCMYLASASTVVQLPNSQQGATCRAWRTGNQPHPESKCYNEQL